MSPTVRVPNWGETLTSLSTVLHTPSRWTGCPFVVSRGIMRLFLRSAVALVVALSSSLVFASPGEAAVYTSSGLRCTEVGTGGPDRLIGTAERDVICGLGGRDTIAARGGNDLIEAGRGDDAVDAGAGADVVFAGGGNDDAAGGVGPGSDRLHGGSGADQLGGGDGADRLWGDAGEDVGGGDAGPDLLYGGTHDDWLSGDAGADTLLGQGDNDDLVGGPSGDELNGGEGTNWCTLDAQDIQRRCVYDRELPEADRVSVSADRVDVTHGDREVTVRVHVTDDTGVTSVGVSPGPDAQHFPYAIASLRSGDVRNGWWDARLVFRRWSMPGTYHVQVRLWDRVQRRGTVETTTTIQVLDRTPDLEQPAAFLLNPAPTDSFDVRTTWASVPVRARLIDAISGVNKAEACIHEPRIDGRAIAMTCANMQLRSGGVHDGIWVAPLWIDRQAAGGLWNVSIATVDEAHSRSGQRLTWLGPGEYHDWADPQYERPLPDGMGSFNVVGSSRSDTTPPSVTSVNVTPTEVDTLGGPATVRFTVQASDARGGGVRGVYVALVPFDDDGTGPQGLDTSLDLIEGGPLNGTWTGTFRFPQGSPPDTYYLSVLVWDQLDNMRRYVSTGHPDAPFSDHLLENNPTVTVVESTAHQP